MSIEHSNCGGRMPANQLDREHLRQARAVRSYRHAVQAMVSSEAKFRALDKETAGSFAKLEALEAWQKGRRLVEACQREVVNAAWAAGTVSSAENLCEAVQRLLANARSDSDRSE